MKMAKINIFKRPEKNFIWAMLALAAILLFNLLFTPNFFKIEIKDGHLFGSLIDIIDRATPVMLVALGMTLVIAIGGIDISVGSMVAVSGAVASILITVFQAPMIVIVLVPIIFCLILGAWNGSLIAYVGIQPIVATLILMVAGRGIAQLVTNGQIIVFEHKPFEFIGGGFLFGLPFSCTIILIIFVLLLYFTRRTALGLFIESIGCNSTASYYAGIKTTTIKMMVYIFSGLCCGVAGLITASDIKAADANSAGLNMELEAILAVAIGGTAMNGGKFSLGGTVIGALIMQSLTTTILTRGVPVEVTAVLKALVVVFVFLLQSEDFQKLVSIKKLQGKMSQ